MTLIPVRSMLPFIVEVQTETGWQPHLQLDDLDQALMEMDMVVLIGDVAARVVERENGNIVDESFPEPFIQEVETFVLDWKEHGF